MLMIVEGPDGAGKTSFIHTLAKELQRQGRINVLISPHGNPHVPARVEYRELHFYRRRSEMDLILDRSWLSEEVYGPRWRGAGLPPGVRDDLNKWALDRGAIFIFLDAPDKLLIERVLGERGDDLVHSEEEVVAIAARYRDLVPFGITRSRAFRLVWPYDPQELAELLIHQAREADRRNTPWN